MHGQEKSVPLEKLALVPAKFEFIGGQCDTTPVAPCLMTCLLK